MCALSFNQQQQIKENMTQILEKELSYWVERRENRG